MIRKDEYYTPGKLSLYLSLFSSTISIYLKSPGPSSYDVKSELSRSKMNHPSSIFVSQTTREPIIEVESIYLSSIIS